MRCFKYNELGHYTREYTKGIIGEPSVQGLNALRMERVARPPITARTTSARSEASRAPQAQEKPTGQTNAVKNVQ